MGKSSKEEEGCFRSGDCSLIHQERVEKRNKSSTGAHVPYAEGGFCCCGLGFFAFGLGLGLVLVGFWVVFCFFVLGAGLAPKGERRNSKASATKKG